MTNTTESLTLTLADVDRISPLAGRCFIQLDRPATMSDLIHIPEVAQRKSTGDILWPGTVLKLTPRNTHDPDYQPEEVKDGDKVWVALMLEDVDREVLLTRNTRIWAGLIP